jgi:hypothetical protein
MGNTTIDALDDELREDVLEENWKDTIHGTIEDESAQEDTLNWIRTYREETIEIIQDVSDPEDAETSLILRYLEMKSRWIIMNNQIQYQAVETGAPDEVLMTRGSLLSNFLERLENHLDDDQIESITGLLSEPVETLSEKL